MSGHQFYANLAPERYACCTQSYAGRAAFKKLPVQRPDSGNCGLWHGMPCSLYVHIGLDDHCSGSKLPVKHHHGFKYDIADEFMHMLHAFIIVSVPEAKATREATSTELE